MLTKGMPPDDLKTLLDNLYETIQKDSLDLDPLEWVNAFNDPKDREIAGFFAAVLAVGRADLIRRAVSDVFERMGNAPYRFIMEGDVNCFRGAFEGFVYRFFKADDIGLMSWWLHQIIETHGSIQAFFLKGDDGRSENIGPALSSFVRRILGLEIGPFFGTVPPPGSGIRQALSDPASGGACKRMNLYLRWMVRRDNVDRGFWNVSPSRLVIPLDTHLTRLSRNLGLTRRSSPGWPMAVEITESLKRFNPEDPVRYDFALCTVGKLNACPERGPCPDCPIESHCLKFGSYD
jgi:uncharacterized protein (TIGR02757 family)